MCQYDTTFDFRINEGHCDLYFMVQWFCLICWSLFDVWKSYFGIMSQYDPTFDLKINVSQCDLYFMVQWFCLISWKTVWCTCMNIILRDYEAVWLDIWPQNKCRSLWHVFHGSVILAYIWKTIWCTLGLWVSMTWHLTFDLKINVQVTVTYILWSSDFALISW